MYKDLVGYSEKFSNKMFSAYARVWYIGVKLSHCWDTLGRSYINPFYAEDAVLPSVELKEALQILAPYWKSSPLDFNKPLDKIELECIDIAYDIIMRFIRAVCPKSIRVCVTDKASSISSEFDYSFTYSEEQRGSTKLLLDSDVHDVLQEYKGCDIWIEGSSRILTILGVRALNYTVFNPYSFEPITEILFSDSKDYITEYEEYLVVGWNRSVRQYERYICDCRPNVINAHFMHFTHETDNDFELAIKGDK